MAMRVLVQTKPETLECRLSHDEFLDRARALAEACQDIESEEGRQTQVKADLKAQMTRLEAERSRLSLIVTRKAEPRETPTTIYADDARGLAITIREDTGEVVRQRELTPNERQLPLPEPSDF